MILTNSCKKVLNNFIQQYTIIENQRINLHALSMLSRFFANALNDKMFKNFCCP